MAIHVLIIGAGIGGLVLAHGLRKHKISFHVYERDAAQDFRAQGYRIRVAREGAEALRYLLDEETWRLFELTCGVTELRPIPEIDAATARAETADMRDDAATKKEDAASKPYTVDRTLFREVLLRGLDGRISYGKMLTRYDLEDEGVSAVFEDGTTAHGSLLVGADGANSSVSKQLLPNHQILDTGARCLYGKTELRTDVLRDCLPMVTEGGIQVVKDRTQEPFPVMIFEPVIFPRRQEMRQANIEPPTDYLYWVLTIRAEALETLGQGNCHLTTKECEALALRISERWHPGLRAIMKHQMPEQTALLPIRSVPSEITRWDTDERVTLLGDAIHLMGPTSGSGAIVAIRDARHLCETLSQDGQSKASFARYEDKMREYAGAVVKRSWENADAMFKQTTRNNQNIGDVMAANRRAKS